MKQVIDKQTMTSREIATLANKPHNDLMKAIRKMESAWRKVNGGNFSLVKYTDEKGEKRPMYQLSKTECLYIATKFNDEARARLILRWEELEEQQARYIKPTTLRITSTRPLISRYVPYDVAELTRDFLGVVYKDLLKVEPTRLRLRLARNIEYYARLIEDQIMQP